MDDLCRRWARQLSGLRARAVTLRRGLTGTNGGACELLDDALDTCDAVLRELGGAQLRIQCAQRDARNEADRREHLLRHAPVPCLTTDVNGLILDANECAAALFNTGARKIQGRLLLHYVEERESFCALLRALQTENRKMAATVSLRPRERAPRGVSVVIVPDTSNDSPVWLWFFLAPAAATVPLDAGGDAGRTATSFTQ